MAEAFSEEGLEGSRKVAVLLLALGKPLAGKVLQYFSPEELRQVSHSAQGLRKVSSGELERLVNEFASHFTQGIKFLGTSEEFEDLLNEAITPEQKALLDPQPEAPPPPPPPPWQEVSIFTPELLISRLASEHPQVIAFFLTKMPAEMLASVLLQWPAEKRGDLLQRMLTIGPVSPRIVALLEDWVREVFLSKGKTTPENTQGRARLADIVNRLDKADAEVLLSDLANKSPIEAQKIKALLFSFEDIVTLSQKARSTLFDAISTDKVVMALQGASPELQEAALSALAARARRMVEAELKNTSDPPPAKDITAARREIATTALSLSAKGLLVLREEAVDV